MFIIIYTFKLTTLNLMLSTRFLQIQKNPEFYAANEPTKEVFRKWREQHGGWGNDGDNGMSNGIKGQMSNGDDNGNKADGGLNGNGQDSDGDVSMDSGNEGDEDMSSDAAGVSGAGMVEFVFSVCNVSNYNLLSIFLTP